MFRKLRWKNFLSTGNIFTEIDLDKHASTLIVGENGAGKSTILDALSYSLFGKPFRKINKSLLVNSITNKSLVVEIEFDINNVNYKIIRGMKPNVFEVYQNGALINQSAEMRDYQEILEKHILKINQKSFCQVVILGSATFQPFMQLSASQRREIIEDLLDLQIFTVMNQLLKDKISGNNERLADAQTEQRIIQEKLKIIKQQMIDAQSNDEDMIEEKRKMIDDTNLQIADAENKCADLNFEIKKLLELSEDKKSIENRLDKIKKLKIQLEHKIETINNDIKFFHDNEHCPVCKQDIEDSHKSNIINEKNTQKKDIDSNIPKLLEEYESANSKLADILANHAKITDMKMELHQLRSRVSSWQDYRNQLDSDIEKIIYRNQNSNDDKIEELDKDMKEIERLYTEISNEKDLYSVASSLLKDGGIKAKIIKQYVPVINKLINKYLSAMEFLVQFELDEEFNETIKSRYRDMFSYASFSEGEKQRIDLALMFTWRAVAKLRNTINTNLLIMDEILDSSLDSNGTDEFLKIINGFTTDTNTFIISHKGDQLIDKFAHVLKFEKHKNFSKLA